MAIRWILALENTTTGNNVTYQWQSAEYRFRIWTDIPGAIYPFYTATVLGVTWYQCVTCTCTNSSMTTSTPVTKSL
ncbi:MAG: hypothetical protein H6549_08815 [Chitinophagales bacterium]|nr:hypothetical protein [Chitinophagales bacterium]